MLIKSMQFRVKEVDESGAFTGYGNVFDVKDSYGDVVVKGAFTDTLAKHKKEGTKPGMYWMHDAREIIGAWTKLEEDDRGLLVEGQLALGVQKADEANILMKNGAVNGLSIGYWVKNETWDADDEINYLNEVDLVEVSVVGVPANSESRVEVRKNALLKDESFELRDLESSLRDPLGLSRKQAKAFIAEGAKGLTPRDVEQQKLMDALASVTKSIQEF